MSINKSQKEDTREKNHNVLFSENQFCPLSVSDLLHLTPWVVWSEIFTRHSSLCLLSFWLIFEPQICPTRLAISFLLITARAKRKVHLCVKLFDFFRGWILIRLTWNLSRFVQISEILCNTLPKLVKFRYTFCNFILESYCAEKNHITTFIYCLHPGKEARP